MTDDCFTCQVNNGQVEAPGGTIYEHFHLLPRYAGMPGLGPKLVDPLFAGQWACSAEEAESAAAAIRGALVWV